jgi:hypothetical protein
MKCLRCGWCCANISPINSGYCPKLNYDGKKAICSIYIERPDRCRKEDMGGADICPVGMSTLKLSPSDALEYWRKLEQEDDLRAIIAFIY